MTRPIVLIALAIAGVLSGAPSSASVPGSGGIRALSTHPLATPASESASAPAAPLVEPLEVAIGIGVIAALALFAWFVGLAGRRRRVQPSAPEGGNDAPVGPTAAEQQLREVLHQRTLRRARMRLEEDPIIASMGVSSATLPEAGAANPRRSARRSPPT